MDDRRAPDPRVEKLVADVAEMKAELSANTEVTRQIRDTVSGLRILVKAAKYLTAFAGLVVALIAAWKGIVTFNDVTPR